MLTLTESPTIQTRRRSGARVVLDGVHHQISSTTLLHDVHLHLEPGEIVALAGPSGAGKSTLLRTMAGLTRPTTGTVSVTANGHPTGPDDARIGFVPQDDIVHLDLPLERVISHAAALRIDEPPERRRERVDRVITKLGLQHRRDTLVRRLSGGERKRASIAVELLTEPDLFLLDEPTSGLDPAAAASLLRHLRKLAAGGTTVVVTTHATADIERCDRVVLLAAGGRVAFVGTPDEACGVFAVDELSDIYLHLAGEPPGSALPGAEPEPATRPNVVPRSWLAQCWALTRRNADLLTRNRLTAAVLIGAPVLVILMMASLFPAGAFDGSTPAVAIQESYWITFAGFFFGLTYGLLQIAVEMPIVRRDRVAQMGAGAYVASKVAVLTPVLAVVSTLMLVVLRVLDRLPALGAREWLGLGATVLLVSVAALATGLFASAAVTDTTQATLALPLICFPQVLFAGALVARPDMSGPGRAMSEVLVTRWGFEAVGRGLHVGETIDPGSGLAGFGPALTGATVTGWLALGAITLVMLWGTVAVIGRRTARDSLS